MKESYIIEIEYGSDFQKSVWHEYLVLCLKGVKMAMEQKHKKNNMRIVGIEEDN
jgi:hypothetical protein